MNYRLLPVSVLLILFSVIDTCHAFCTDGRHPSVREEFETSTIVVLGKQVHKRNVSSSDDPEGVAATIYAVSVLEIFKGSAGRRISIFSENTTSRFPMDKGKTYLLFVRASPDGFFVDNCGNSAAIDDKGTTNVLSEVRSLALSRAQ
jgi:hypothetical protein